MDFQRKNTKITLLEDYYEHFSEETRLDTRHGKIEFITALKYIEKYLDGDKNKRILDIGAGTGKYSIELYNRGYNVTAVELVKHNIDVFKSINSDIPLFQGNALDLSLFNDDTFDMVLLFGPMYHLLKEEEKVKALLEAKRVVKKNGIILVSYLMNEYALIVHGFMKNNIMKSKSENRLDDTYHVINKDNDLYSYLRIEDINRLNSLCDLERIKIVSEDGPANYLRVYLNKMDDETYNEFINYHLSICEREDLLGASSHILDILKK